MKVDINGNKEQKVVITSFDNKGNFVMQEMSAVRYFIFKIMKKINTKNRILAIAISVVLISMFTDDLVRVVKNFPERFVSALEISRDCDNNVSGCQYNSKIN